mgnify:CR=1 FL=1
MTNLKKETYELLVSDVQAMLTEKILEFNNLKITTYHSVGER